MSCLKKNKVYTLLPATSVPSGHKIIGLRQVLKIKINDSKKIRTLVLGYGQVPGRDYGGTFAPVCRLQSISMVLAIAMEYNLEYWKLDYNAAFLNADVEEDIYVKIAPGCDDFDENGISMVIDL